ncbi:MAG: imelysin family protein [Minicystis sp.]
MRKFLSIATLPLALLACSSSAPETDEPNTPSEPPPSEPALTDDQYRDQALRGMHDALLAEVEVMRLAAIDLQKAAPTPPDRGWDALQDEKAITAMRDAWVRARTAYEHVEGALAPLFPDIDTSIDARYDDFMTLLAAKGGDTDLFDGKGVTGMHAVERVVYADVTPARVVAFEKSLPGYQPAMFPQTAEEAAAFKADLCQRLISDIEVLEAQWTPANIHIAIAYQGLVMLVQEQAEKVVKAASNEEESRYSQRTMADLRDNLAGARMAYEMFRPWLLSKTDTTDPARDGKTIDGKIKAGFDALDVAYAEVEGASIPEPPATWSAEKPSETDSKTPFGRLYTSVNAAVDPANPESAVAQMNAAAEVLGFGGLTEGQ